MSQIPLYLLLTCEDPSSFSSRSSESIPYNAGNTYLNWFLQKPGQSKQFLPPSFLGLQTCSVAVDQEKISHSKSIELRLRMLEFITPCKLQKFLSQWYTPKHKPPYFGWPSCHMLIVEGTQFRFSVSV
jgi:hypothetical protein